MHPYGTERERCGAIANVLAKDGSNDELARGNGLREGPQDLGELLWISSPPTCSTATKQKKIKCSEGSAGVRGHAIARLPPAKCPPASPLLSLAQLGPINLHKTCQ